ncbi:MAG: hypothetical protein NZR01_05695 [Bryobacteraceae bacterium]|nr:hypothetical protein [Bryobacteraceae bacterium]
MRALLFGAVYLNAAAWGQPFYFGIKGGVLLSRHEDSSVFSGRTGTSDSFLAQKRFAFGPAVEIGLPFHLRLESGFLYRRFRSSQNFFTGPSFWDAYDRRGSRWEFPVVLKREFGAGRARPFLGAGGAWSRMPAPDLTVALYREAGPPPWQVSVVRTTGVPDNTGGWIATGGVRIRGPARIRFTPEIRFVRWTSGQMLPTRNQAEFFLGIGF